MSIKERQQKEKNHITLVLGIIIIGYSTILALLGFVDKTADLSIAIPRAIVSVIIFIAFILCYFKFKNTEKNSYVCIGCMLLEYAVTILTETYIYVCTCIPYNAYHDHLYERKAYADSYGCQYFT